MKQALPSGAKEHMEEHAQRADLYTPVLLAAAFLLSAAFVIVAIALYRADAFFIIPTTSPIPLVVLDPSVYLPESTSLAPVPTDGNLPVSQAR